MSSRQFHKCCDSKNMLKPDPGQDWLPFFVTSLPPFPANSIDIDIAGCNHLRTLPALPGSTVSLNCNGCCSLRALPPLPRGMQILSTYSCRQLRFLPSLPESIAMINCRGCPLLLELPPIPLLAPFGPIVVLCEPGIRLPDVYPPHGVHLNFEDSEASATLWAASVRARHVTDRSLLSHLLPLAALMFV